MPTKKVTVLVADDDTQIVRLVTRNLQMEGFVPIAAANGQEALDHIEAKMPDLILLDVMMPKLDGFTVCQRVREFSRVPIIMITARGQDQDKVHGLNLGADDYLTKPFSVDELLARVRAVLRRSEPPSAGVVAGDSAQISVRDVTVDLSQHLVTRDGAEITLTPLEYRLIAYLIQNAGRVLTQNMLLAQVWGSEYEGEYHMLQVNINRLRRKLEADSANPIYILTKPGVGYFFVGS